MDEDTREPILSILTLIVETAAKLLKDGHRVIIVSSGAVGVGLRRMDVECRPKHLPAIQVCCGQYRGRVFSANLFVYRRLRQLDSAN